MQTPLNISQLISRVESDDNQFAMRFEPACSPKTAEAVKYAREQGVSLSTAQVCMCTSWGLFQIMGYNLLTSGLSVSLVQFCSNPQMQNIYFQKFLVANGLDQITQDFGDFISDPALVRKFATVYNGPGNVDAYIARMMECAK